MIRCKLTCQALLRNDLTGQAYSDGIFFPAIHSLFKLFICFIMPYDLNSSIIQNAFNFFQSFHARWSFWIDYSWRNILSVKVYLCVNIAPNLPCLAQHISSYSFWFHPVPVRRFYLHDCNMLFVRIVKVRTLQRSTRHISA